MRSYKVFNAYIFYGLIFLLFLPIIISFISRYHDPSYNDFEAFYISVMRWSEGAPVYVKTDAFPFKYPPFTLIFFRPLLLLRMDQARDFLGYVNLLACLSVPFAIQFYFYKNFNPQNKKQMNDFLICTFLALAASLRFIDNEFHSKNINQFTYALIIWSLAILRNFRSIFSQVIGNFLFVFGGIFKLTPLLGLSSKFHFKKQNFLALTIALLIVALLPNPKLWINWFEQIKNTTGYFPFSDRSIYFQGFFAIGSYYLGLPSRSSISLLLSIPLIIMLIKSSLKLNNSSGAHRDLLTLLFIQLSLLMNPLPWQHIYGFYWILIPFIYHLTKTEKFKKLLLVLSLFLALSPRSIAGREISYWLELHQSIAIVSILLIVFGVIIVRDETSKS